MTQINCPTCCRVVDSVFDHVDEDCETWDEKSDVDYLRDLSERLREIPVMYGIDGYDIDRLSNMATTLELSKMHE